MRLIIMVQGAFAHLLVSAHLFANEVHVAVAANFAAPMQVLSEEFSRTSGHQVKLTAGSTGKLYAQIENGAPLDVFLSADQETPAKLEAEGLAVRGTRFTYAIGKLVLFSTKPDYVDAEGAILRRAPFEHLAVANPKLAPYGAAAVTVLTKLHLLEALRPKLVEGESIAQTLEFVASGNAELGFVALSQILSAATYRPGSYWRVPETLYPALNQDAIELRPGLDNSASHALLAFLKSEHARAIIASYGYGLAPRPAAAMVPAAGASP